MDGLAGSEAVCFLKRLAGGLSSRWDRPGVTLKFWAGFRPDRHLLFCMLLAYVYGGLIPSGGALFRLSCIVLLFLSLLFLCSVFLFLFFSFALFCCLILFVYPVILL